MAKFKNGDLVKNVGDSCRSIVVDATLGLVKCERLVAVVDLEGPGRGIRYTIREEVLRLVEER